MTSTPGRSSEHLDVVETSTATIVTIRDKRINEDLQALALKEEMIGAVRQTRHKGVVVDMKHVEYITSIGILPLVALRKVAEEVGCHVVLCNLSEFVARILTISQLIVESRAHVRHFAVAKDLESAIGLLVQPFSGGTP